MKTEKLKQPSNFPIRIEYQGAEYEWGFRYEHAKDPYWEGSYLYWERCGYKSEKEALEAGIKYVKSMLLAKQREAQAVVDDVNLRLEELNLY